MCTGHGVSCLCCNLLSQEAKIAEALFIPPQKKKVAKPKPQILSPAQQRRGLRSSARQRVHKEQILAIEQERQEAAEHAGEYLDQESPPVLYS